MKPLSITSISGTTCLTEIWGIILPITTIEGCTGQSCLSFTHASRIKSRTDLSEGHGFDIACALALHLRPPTQTTGFRSSQAMKNARALTEQYFALSNDRDLTSIFTLLNPEATYSSNNTGLFYGVNDIRKMMTAFFADHPYIQWTILELRELSEHITEVDFTVVSTDREGNQTERSGLERIVVASGAIRHIEVHIR